MKKLLNKIKDKAKKLWVAVDGKKTAISAGIFIANVGMKAFFPNVMTPDQHAFVELLASIIGGTGISHKAVKEKKKIKEVLSKAQRLITK